MQGQQWGLVLRFHFKAGARNCVTCWTSSHQDWTPNCLGSRLSENPSWIRLTPGGYKTNYRENSTQLNILTPLITCCKDLINRDWDCRLNHIYREGNASADIMASKFYHNDYGTVIFDEPPPEVRASLLADQLQISRPRIVRTPNAWIALPIVPKKKKICHLGQQAPAKKLSQNRHR